MKKSVTSPNLFNLASLDHAFIFPPHDIYVLHQLLSSTSVLQLAEHYPQTGFQPHFVEEHNKDFQIKVEFINCGDAKSLSSNSLLHPVWKDFLASLFASKYLEKLSELTQLDLANKFCRLEFLRMKPHYLLDAHYDKEPKKVLTQVFYLNPYWENAWGGLFHLLNPDNREETLFQIPPLNHFSVLIKATPRAWHKVNVLKPGAEVRMTFQLEFYDL